MTEENANVEVEETVTEEVAEVETVENTETTEVEEPKGLELEAPDFGDDLEEEVNPADTIRSTVEEVLAKHNKPVEEKKEEDEDKPLTKKELQELLNKQEEQQRVRQYQARQHQALLEENTNIAETYLDNLDEKLKQAGVDGWEFEVISENSEYQLKELLAAKNAELRSQGKLLSPKDVKKVTKAHWDHFSQKLKGKNISFKKEVKQEETLSPVADTVTTRPAKPNPDQKQLQDLMEKANTGKLTPSEVFKYKRLLEQSR